MTSDQPGGPTVTVDESIAASVERRDATVCAAAPGTATLPDHTAAATAFDPAADATALVSVDATVAGAPAAPHGPRSIVPRSDPQPPAGAAASSRAAARYVVVGRAGEGGMGTVHVAKDVDLLRRVALKEMAASAAASPDARARFVREVQVTAQLDHPHVVPVYGLEVTQGNRPAYAMKLVEGRTLADLIADSRARVLAGEPGGEMHGLAARLEHFLKVCDAVSYAHERGVIHRDLKPANVMLGSHNEVYVMDWGLCRVAGSAGDAGGPAAADLPETGFTASDSATRCGSVVGTPRYMAPEQARGLVDALGPKSDQYALGLILQELVTLRPAIEGRTMTEVLTRASAGQREPVTSETGGRAARELVAVIGRAAAADPAHRYASVAAFAADVRRYLRGESVAARPDSPWQRLLRFVARHRQAAGVAVLAFASICFAVIAGLLWRQDRALTDQQFRERRLQALVNDVAHQGDVLQTRLLLLQSSVAGLAESLEEGAEHGAPFTGRLPWAGAPDSQPDRQGSFSLSWTGTPAPTVQSDALARRVLPATARIRPWFAHAEAVLDWADTRSAAPRPAASPAIHQVQVVFDGGFDVVVPSPTVAPPDRRAESWFAACRSAGDTSRLMLGVPASSDAFLFCSPLHADEQRPIGALVVTLSPVRVLERLAASWALASNRGVLLLDAGGRVLATHGPGAPGLAAEVSSVFVQAPSGVDAGFVERDTTAGPVVLAFDRVHPYDWILVVAVSAEAAVAGLPHR